MHEAEVADPALAVCVRILGGSTNEELERYSSPTEPSGRSYSIGTAGWNSPDEEGGGYMERTLDIDPLVVPRAIQDIHHRFPNFVHSVKVFITKSSSCSRCMRFANSAI
jgi:hypothetical protein